MKVQLVASVLFVTFFMGHVWAKIPVAQVEQLRGHVTQLKPGHKEATPVLLGEQILEDTSIVTGDRSFVRLKFKDGSLMNLGPSGKVVVVQMPEQGPGVVSLLKGTMRSQVEKNKNIKTGEHKLFVKTRSAAMGVRGTDFQTVYNPENKATSLLTFKGEVAMTPLKESANDLEIKKVRVNNEDVEVQDSIKKADSKKELTQLDGALKGQQTVVVKPGQFSGTVQSLETVSKPVKISPVQLQALYKNQELQTKGEEEVAKTTSSNLKEETRKANVTQAEQEAPPEGYFNEKTKEFAPKSGGFLDLKTGLYIPPGDDSEFDSQKKVYIPKSVGSVDGQTGQYKAPEGLKLDAKSGFVVDEVKVAEMNEKEKEEVQNSLLTMTQQLNKTIAKDLILLPEKGQSHERLMAFVPFGPRELFTKNIVSLALTDIQDNLKYEKASDATFERTMKSSRGKSLDLSWLMASEGVFQPLVEFSMRTVKYDESDIRQKNERLYSLNLGTRFYVNEKLHLLGAFGLDQKHYVTYTSDSSTSTSTSPEFKPVTVPKFKFGAQYALYSGPRFQVTADGTLGLTLSRDSADFSLDQGFSVSAALSGRYFFTQKIWGQLGLEGQREFQKAHDATLSATIQRQETLATLRLGMIF